MSLNEKICQLADELEGATIDIRRDFHRYPETGWREFRTTSLIAARLDQLGYEVKLGKAVINPEFIMGRPVKEEIEREKIRAVKQGAPEKWLEKMTGDYTGLVATLKCGGEEKPVVALRFDY